ncbi:hypothetical protein F5Y03DRAFT_401830 [Xylaria venustula]|nr:hypothetical protein F5Y03DRAFT_401830 [Xylaria venustula]
MTRSLLENLPEELLSIILELAMLRNSPFQIDWEPEELTEYNQVGGRHVHTWYQPRPMLKSPTGATDPLSVPTTPQSPCPHRRSQQTDHVADWVAISSTCRIFHRLGRPAFFTAKVIAMRTTLLPRLEDSKDGVKRGFARIFRALTCRKLLTRIRHVVLIDAREQQPMWMLGLPRFLASNFPMLARCTLIFGHPATDSAEWVTAALAVSVPARKTLLELLHGIGLSENLELEETLGTGSTWDYNAILLSRYIYPILRMKSKAFRKNSIPGGSDDFPVVK